MFYCPGALKHGTSIAGDEQTWGVLKRDDPDYLFYCEGSYYRDFRFNHLGYWPFCGGLTNGTLPARPKARYRPLSVSTDPMCWLVTDKHYRNSTTRRPDPRTAPHRVGAVNYLTIPYNVVHLDGHADTHQFDPSQQLWQQLKWARNWPGDWPYPHFDTDEDRK